MTLLGGAGKTRTAAGLAVAGTVVAVLAGCSNASTSSPGTAASATSTATSSTSTAAPTSAASSSSAAVPPATSPAASPSPATSTAAGVRSCSSSDLRLSLGSGSGAAGSVYRDIEFRNASASSCTLYGFPGVSLLGGSPARQIGAAATRAPNSRASLVTLKPGGTASALMRVADAQNYPTATCHPVASTTLRVYPPNQTAPLTVAYHSTGCSSTSVKLIQVNAVQAGTGTP